MEKNFINCTQSPNLDNTKTLTVEGRIVLVRIQTLRDQIRFLESLMPENYINQHRKEYDQ